MDGEIFLDEVVDGCCDNTGLHVFLDLLYGHVEEFIEIVEMIGLHGDKQLVAILDLPPVEGKLLEGMGALAVNDTHALGILVELRMPLPSVVPHDVLDHPPELPAGDLEHPEKVVERRVLDHILVLYYRSHDFFTDRAGTHKHYIKAALPLYQVCVQIAHLGFLITRRVRKRSRKVRDDAAVFLVGLAFVAAEQIFHDRIRLRGLRTDLDALPFPLCYLIAKRIVHDVEPPDMPCAGPDLNDRHTVDHLGLIHQSMCMPADYHIHAPVRVEKLRELTVSLDADMREKHDHVCMPRPIVVADNTDFLGSLLDVNESTYDVFCLG